MNTFPNLSTARVKFTDLQRIERAYGDLDDAYGLDSFESIFDELQYSSDDRLADKSNPSKVVINGDIYSGLTALRHALREYGRYRKLRLISEELDALGDENPNARGEKLRSVAGDMIALAEEDTDTAGNETSSPAAAGSSEREHQRVHLERDMQTALRRNIGQLEEGLQISDHGSERSVPSGRIDITAIDSGGVTVVIELKAGRAGRDAVAQIQSYMGDLTLEGPGPQIRGILVAHEFDPRALAAARVVPTLQLKKYDIAFLFQDAS